LISPYEPKNIDNADKTGWLFGHYQQNHSRLREISVRGGKCAKKDLQCYCVRIWWENWKASRDGKAAKPRCVKNLKINNLSVIWRSNKKAWMTAAIMEE
jgi:hypothetical protein